MAAVLGNCSFTINEWRVDPSLNRISRGEDFVKIDPQNMKVLELLASRPGEVFSQTEIEQSAWPDVVVTPNSVYQSIAHLRRALGDNKSKPQYIETIARKGYRCVAKVVSPVVPSCPDSHSAASRRYNAGSLPWLIIGVAVLLSITALLVVDALPKASTSHLPDANGSKLARAQLAMHLGDAARQSREYSLALRHYQACLDEAEDLFSKGDTFFAEVYIKRARLLYALDKTDAALKETEEAIQILEHSSTLNNPLFIWARSLYAEILTSTGRHHEAEVQAEEAIRLAVLLHGEDDTPVIEARGSLAQVRISAGDWIRAEAILRDVLDDLSKLVRDDGLELNGYFRTLLAWALYQQGRDSEAVKESRIALETFQKLGEPGGHSASAYQVLADALIRHGDFAGAEYAVRQCLRILNDSNAEGWRIARADSTLAEILIHKGHPAEASEKLQQAANILELTDDSIAQFAYAETRRRLDLLAKWPRDGAN
jgi:DNA-binding winged helix-turn-helix (wHTH) protein/tetratricopeptide (TPR) repeat protein